MEIWDGKYKRKAKEITCEVCKKKWLIRADRSHSGLCRSCKFSGKNNPMHGKTPYNKKALSWSKRVRLERKKKIVLMMGNTCSHCGAKNLPISCYTAHHIEPETKVFSIMAKLNENTFEKKWDIWKQEIEKCELLCLHCHAIHHYGNDKVEEK